MITKRQRKNATGNGNRKGNGEGEVMQFLSRLADARNTAEGKVLKTGHEVYEEHLRKRRTALSP